MAIGIQVPDKPTNGQTGGRGREVKWTADTVVQDMATPLQLLLDAGLNGFAGRSRAHYAEVDWQAPTTPARCGSS